MENPGTEKALLKLLSTGSHKAFRVIFDYHKGKVYNYALKVCRETYLAEEVVQDVFMKVWTLRANVQNIDKLDSYIMVMTRNQAFTVLKRIALDQHCQAVKGQQWSEVHEDTENLVYYRETAAILENALNTLPPQQRVIYKMCHLEGMKHKDVADRLSISPLTVKSHLRYAVKTIRTIVVSNYFMIFFLSVNQVFRK